METGELIHLMSGVTDSLTWNFRIFFWSGIDVVAIFGHFSCAHLLELGMVYDVDRITILYEASAEI